MVRSVYIFVLILHRDTIVLQYYINSNVII